MTREEFKVIAASSIGTAFEWYDFFLFGALAPTIGAAFFGQFDGTTQSVFALLTFAAGFAVRPIGALVFARFGDLIGRKSIFLLTLLLMGVSTAAVGVLPTSRIIGLWAPAILVSLRIVQGLAISGEFGGAVIYVAEHAPAARRGFYAGWIPTTVGLSVFTSIGVLLLVQGAVGAEAFRDWGWRIPFVISVVPLGVSIWIRLRLHESPIFLKMKAEGHRSQAPVSEAFGRRRNLHLAVILLFGLIAPHAMIGYIATFYALVLLTTSLGVDAVTANILFAAVMFCATFLCVFFSWLSDQIGRKPVVIAAFALAALTIIPVFTAITALANPGLAQARHMVVTTLASDPAQCSLQFDPAGIAHRATPCDRAKQLLSRYAVAYTSKPLPAGAATVVVVGKMPVAASDDRFEERLVRALRRAGYPEAGDPRIARIGTVGDLFDKRVLGLFGLLLLLNAYGQMGQGPSAAAMVELFPTRIRYTAISLPFQIGTGWFGGLLPAILIAINAEAGSLTAGLWYPITVLTIGTLVSLFLLPETRGRDLGTIEG